MVNLLIIAKTPRAAASFFTIFHQQPNRYLQIKVQIFNYKYTFSTANMLIIIIGLLVYNY